MFDDFDLNDDFDDYDLLNSEPLDTDLFFDIEDSAGFDDTDLDDIRI